MVNMNTTKNGRQTLSDHRTTVKRSPPIGLTGKAKSRKAHPPCERTFPAPVEDEKDFSQKAHPPPTPAHLLCASHGVTGDVLRRAAGRVDLQKSAFLTQCCCFFSLCCFHSVNEGRLPPVSSFQRRPWLFALFGLVVISLVYALALFVRLFRCVEVATCSFVYYLLLRCFCR